MQQISWAQFSIFTLILASAYYLYVLIIYFSEDVSGWVRGKIKKRLDANCEANKHDAKEKIEEATLKGNNQAELFKEDRHMEQQDNRFKKMERAIALIRQVIAQGIANKLDRENLLDHIREVLSDYRDLRGTAYDHAINNFLVRVCASEFSMALNEEDLTALWI